MSKPIVYVVMSIRFEEYSESAPDNAIATHGAFMTRDAAESHAELLRYNYPDSLEFWVSETSLSKAA